MTTNTARAGRSSALARFSFTLMLAGLAAACVANADNTSNASTSSTTTTSNASGTSSTSNLEMLRAESLALVNQERAGAGLPPLVLDRKLNDAAQAHAEDMRRRNYYSHVSPTGGEPPDRYKRAGGSLYGHFAENIARCYKCATPADKAAVLQLHEQWMGSPVHRKNFFKTDITIYGFGLAETDRGKHYAVEEFYGPVTEEDVRRAGGFMLHQPPIE